MHTLFHFNLASSIAPGISALRDRLVEGLRRHRNRANARLAAQAFERLDDRTLRDLGFCRGDAGAIGAEAHGLCQATLLRVTQVI